MLVIPSSRNPSPCAHHPLFSLHHPAEVKAHIDMLECYGYDIVTDMKVPSEPKYRAVLVRAQTDGLFGARIEGKKWFVAGSTVARNVLSIIVWLRTEMERAAAAEASAAAAE